MLSPARTGFFWVGILAIVASTLASLPARGDDPPQGQPATNDDQIKAIRPLPAVAIPDDPPPHEGALIDIPLVIEPPDILVVEVLEALAGRPITGERLVRPDGTISLGFYGDVHVRGLTTEQAKAKITLHLRKFLNEDILGLKVIIHEGDSELKALPIPGTKVPIEIEVQPEKRPFDKPDVERVDPPAAPANPPVEPMRPNATAVRTRRSSDPSRQARSPRKATRTDATTRLIGTNGSPIQLPVPAGPPADVEQPITGEAVFVAPSASVRVFVDIVSFNSKIYFVQGDVGTPGRLPFTGKETVLDAMNYAGGLVPTAEPTDIHLYRPAQGGKPARDYVIDFTAILRGDARANLQIFPSDRLVVGRNAIVKKTIEIDRAAAPINSVLNSALQQSFTLRSLGAGAGLINGTDDAERDVMLKRWFDFLWNLPVGNPQNFDASKLLEAIQRRPEPVGEAKPATTPK